MEGTATANCAMGTVFDTSVPTAGMATGTIGTDPAGGGAMGRDSTGRDTAGRPDAGSVATGVTAGTCKAGSATGREPGPEVVEVDVGGTPEGVIGTG